MKIYGVESGVLLLKDNIAFKSYMISCYDDFNAFFDEEIFLSFNKKETLKFAKNYVSVGVDRTYGIVFEIEIDKQCEEILKKEYKKDKYIDNYWFFENNGKKIIYSICKSNKHIIRNFLGKEI